MAILFADRVKDTTSTTGTGNLTLDGTPPTGYQSFNTAFGTSVSFYYACFAGSEWEVGIGHLSAATTLVRDTILASTNSNAAVSFSAGSKTIVCDMPAYHAFRRPKRYGSTTSSATPTINTDNVDIYLITAQAAAITSMTTNLSGTPTEGQQLWISITDNGTARAITWGSSFEGSLPTTTAASTRLDMGFVWNSTTSKWRIVGVSTSSLLNGLVITATTGTFTLASGKTFTVNNTITISGTDGVTYTLPGETSDIGYRNIPQNSQSAAYTCVLADAGKHILHPSADTTARTFTIPANSSVAYAIGTVLTFINQASGGTITIAIITDTMRLAGAGTTGSRTLAANGIATAIKITSTEWIISGTNLT